MAVVTGGTTAVPAVTASACSSCRRPYSKERGYAFCQAPTCQAYAISARATSIGLPEHSVHDLIRYHLAEVATIEGKNKGGAEGGAPAKKGRKALKYTEDEARPLVEALIAKLVDSAHFGTYQAKFEESLSFNDFRSSVTSTINAEKEYESGTFSSMDPIMVNLKNALEGLWRQYNGVPSIVENRIKSAFSLATSTLNNLSQTIALGKIPQADRLERGGLGALGAFDPLPLLEARPEWASIEAYEKRVRHWRSVLLKVDATTGAQDVIEVLKRLWEVDISVDTTLLAASAKGKEAGEHAKKVATEFLASSEINAKLISAMPGGSAPGITVSELMTQVSVLADNLTNKLVKTYKDKAKERLEVAKSELKPLLFGEIRRLADSGSLVTDDALRRIVRDYFATPNGSLMRAMPESDINSLIKLYRQEFITTNPTILVEVTAAEANESDLDDFVTALLSAVVETPSLLEDVTKLSEDEIDAWLDSDYCTEYAFACGMRKNTYAATVLNKPKKRHSIAHLIFKTVAKKAASASSPPKVKKEPKPVITEEQLEADRLARLAASKQRADERAKERTVEKARLRTEAEKVSRAARVEIVGWPANEMDAFISRDLTSHTRLAQALIKAYTEVVESAGRLPEFVEAVDKAVLRVDTTDGRLPHRMAWERLERTILGARRREKIVQVAMDGISYDRSLTELLQYGVWDSDARREITVAIGTKGKIADDVLQHFVIASQISAQQPNSTDRSEEHNATIASEWPTIDTDLKETATAYVKKRLTSVTAEAPFELHAAELAMRGGTLEGDFAVDKTRHAALVIASTAKVMLDAQIRDVTAQNKDRQAGLDKLIEIDTEAKEIEEELDATVGVGEEARVPDNALVASFGDPGINPDRFVSKAFTPWLQPAEGAPAGIETVFPRYLLSTELGRSVKQRLLNVYKRLRQAIPRDAPTTKKSSSNKTQARGLPAPPPVFGFGGDDDSEEEDTDFVPKEGKAAPTITVRARGSKRGVAVVANDEAYVPPASSPFSERKEDVVMGDEPRSTLFDATPNAMNTSADIVSQGLVSGDSPFNL